MYIPPRMAMEDEDECGRFIEAFSFGVLFSADLQATHLPLLLNSDRSSLHGHFARANRHWQSLNNQRVLVVFSGPHTYISPSWYADKPAVPTWNYAAVHVNGTLEILDDMRTNELMNAMLEHYEPALLENRDIVTPAYQEKMLRAVVGFRIEIDSMEGKQKLGQLRSADDQYGVAEALASKNPHDAAALLEYMKFTGLGLGEHAETKN